MTNWRELGCVPNSDDEDFSDGELSTQEELITEDHASDTEDRSVADLGNGDAAVELKEVDETQEIEVIAVGQMVLEEMTTTSPNQCISSEDTIMNDIVDGVYTDIDQTPRASQTAGLRSGLEVSVLGSSDEKSVFAFDLSDRSDEWEPRKKTWGGRAVSEVDLSELQDEEDIILQNIQDSAGPGVSQEILREQSPPSVAGRGEDFPDNQNQGHTKPFGNVSHPTTPSQSQEFGQLGQIIDSPAALDSSPLSSPGSTQGTLLPSSTLQRMATLTTAFQITIPARKESHEQWAAPVRSFRERKPIQVNPYLIEGAHYRQTLKSRGVRPLRIQEAEMQAEGAHFGDNESQEAEYVAPPEPNQPKYGISPVQNKSQLSNENSAGDELPTSTNGARDRPKPNKPPQGEAKRRKVTHTYSKGHLARKANQTPRRATHKEDNTLPSLAAQKNGVASDPDIYDLPTNSPPQISRTPLAQPNMNQAVPTLGEGNLGLARAPAEKQRGILSLLDLSSDSDLEPSGSDRSRPVSPTRWKNKPTPIVIPSSPLHSSSSSEGEDEDQEEDESRIITKFQRKTNGVLPASWWKLDKNNQTSGGNNNRRGQSPSKDNTPRPGVARAKISTRARTPEGVFLLGDNSNSSSDESTTISPNTPKGRDAPSRVWIDLDDIMEDDKIDRMLPGVSRNRKTKQTKPRQRVDGNQSSQRGLLASSRDHAFTSRRGSGSTRLHQPKITDHGSSKRKLTKRKKPAGPRVGIVDAVQYDKAKSVTSPPSFIKLAARTAKKRRDQGRQSPTRKLFVLETEIDTRDIQAVLKDWREGTLGFAAERDLGGKYQDSGLNQGRAHGPAAPRHQRFPSPQSLGESRGHLSGRQAKTSNINPSQSRKQKSRQSTLSNIIRRRPVSKGLDTVTRPRPKTQTSTVTAMPGQSRFATHNPNFTPQPAQFEIEAPLDNTLRRLHQAPRRAPAPDIAMPLQYTARSNPHLARFMEDEDLLQRLPRALPATHNPETPEPSRPVPRARRKRAPTRIDSDTIERRQPPPWDIDIDNMNFSTLKDLPRDDKPALRSLLPYGRKYSLNFDTAPLKLKTIFNSNTFIGDGSLSRALNTLPVKDSRRNQGSSFTFGDKIVHWGIYEDSVTADFETFMNHIASVTEAARDKDDLSGAGFHCLVSQAYPFYIFVSNYLAQIISFPDSIDIVSFGQRFLQAIDACCDRVMITLEGNDSHYDPRNSSTRLKLQILTFSLVFSFQMHQLASGDTEVQERLETERSIRKLGRQLLGQLIKCGLDTVKSCYEDQRQRNKYEKGIDREHYVVEAWIIAIQILGQIGSPDISFWQFFNLESSHTNLEKALDIRLFEKQWYMIFTILPLYQFDHVGVVQPTNKHLSENWGLIKILISRPLKVYNSNPEAHFGTIIDYCRVLYARCHYLISSWGWANPDIIIPTLYEFFASNNLANLKNEDEYGSAEFLQNLEKNPSLAVRDSDRCFHLLLKIIVIGINSMKKTSTTKKIGNLVNRLMPNHRRQYPKEEGLLITHLSALKNHHDLLATLYWAAPLSCRPHLDAIRNLVDPETSHRRACTVSMRTWSNLLRFQLHSGEDIKSLECFMEWFDDLVTQTLNQHHAAQGDAETQLKAARDKGYTDLTEGSLKSNIRRNQIELEGVLNDAVKSLDTALSGIGGRVESATAIFTKVIPNILNSYNRLSHKLVVEVLQLVQRYLLVCKIQESPSSIVAQSDEDSQDYGDWSGFDDLVIQDQRKPAARHLLAVVYDPLHRMLSNCFGADKQPEESLLMKVVDTWVLVADFLVQNGLKTWNTYLDSYSSESWSSLRDTEQSRKFTAYFMPKIIQSGDDVYEDNKTIFITFWFKTLVERESMLKFQNEYTATLLNCDPNNPIFVNLPFALDESSGKFNITQLDFRRGRLSLMSTVLANMRESFEATVDDSAKKSLKQEYSQILQAMMKSMKENYKELENKSASSASGAYAKFVQQVVEYLQQHSIDLISIDKFFTDSTAFPLPTDDPLYVVGRLKNYGLKLHNPRAHKELFSFFQSLCQRAAVDGQQEYLVSQLTTALSGNFENGDPTKPTIRAFFLEVIFPVYLECTFRESCGWIMAVPILKASDRVISRMREDIDSTSYGCVKSILSMLSSLLNGIRLAVSSLSPSEIMLPSVLGTFTLMVTTVARAIPIIDWLSEPEDSVEKFAEVGCDCACYLISFSGYIKNLIENREAQAPDNIQIGQRFQESYGSARRGCAAALKPDIKREWVSRGGSWNASGREVCLPLLSGREEGLGAQKSLLSKAVENLIKVACRTERFGKVGRSVDANIWEFEGRGKPYNDRIRGQRKHGKASRMLGNLFC